MIFILNALWKRPAMQALRSMAMFVLCAFLVLSPVMAREPVQAAGGTDSLRASIEFPEKDEARLIITEAGKTVATSHLFSLPEKSNYGTWLEDFTIKNGIISLTLSGRSSCAVEQRTFVMKRHKGAWKVVGMETGSPWCDEKGIAGHDRKACDYLAGLCLITISREGLKDRHERLQTTSKPWKLELFPLDGPQ